jgi:hypothetical protein
MRKVLIGVLLAVAGCAAPQGAPSPSGSLTTLPPVPPPNAVTEPLAASEAPTTEQISEPAGVGPERDDWYLIWVPVRLPDGFATGVRAIPGVEDYSLVRSGNGFLVETSDHAGRVVDRAREGFVYPVEVNAYPDLDAQARFTPTAIAALLRGLDDDSVLLGATSARIRRLGVGATLTFDTGLTVEVAGIVDDRYVGDAEVVTGRPEAEQMGDVRDRYVVVRYTGGLEALSGAVDDLTDEPVVVRKWAEPLVARAGDQVRSQVALKARFGEFAIRPSGGDFEQDPAWRETQIVTASVPLIGSVSCHRDFVTILNDVMTWLDDNGYDDVIDPNAFAGCFNPRFIAGRTDISHHSWGAAADINFFNPPGGAGSPTHPALLRAMYAAGLTSGHTWQNPDPGHFEWFEDVD